MYPEESITIKNVINDSEILGYFRIDHNIINIERNIYDPGLVFYIETLLNSNIKSYNFVKYNKDISLDNIAHDYLLLEDNEDQLYIFIYKLADEQPSDNINMSELLSKLALEDKTLC